MRSIPIGLIALAAGYLVAGYGVGKYEAWWTIAFAFGGLAAGLQEWRGRAAGRTIVMGAGVSVALLLAGMSVFLLFGSLMGGGTPWFAASAGSVVISIGLLLVLRRSAPATPRLGDARRS